jgi:hypothetical protein
MTIATLPPRLRRRVSRRAWLSIGLASGALAWGIAGSLAAPYLLAPFWLYNPEMPPPFPTAAAAWRAILLVAFWTVLPLAPAVAAILLGRSALRRIDRAKGKLLGSGQALFGVMFGLLAVLMSASTAWANLLWPAGSFEAVLRVLK